MTRSAILLVAVLCTACRADFHRPEEREDLLRQLGPGVRAQIVPTGVRVLNATTSEIRIVVVNPYWLGLLASCNDPSSHCTVLRPNAETVVPPSEIHGIEDEPSVLVVRYWRAGDENPIEVSVSRGSGP
jgi:hypothetical protein